MSMSGCRCIPPVLRFVVVSTLLMLILLMACFDVDPDGGPHIVMRMNHEPNQVERLDYVVPARTEEERQDDSDLPEAEVKRMSGPTMEPPLHDRYSRYLDFCL